MTESQNNKDAKFSRNGYKIGKKNFYFDNEAISKLVEEWQKTNDPNLLDKIIVEIIKVAKAVITFYNYQRFMNANELLEELYPIILKSLRKWKSNGPATLFSYISIVVKKSALNITVKNSKSKKGHVSLNEIIIPDNEEEHVDSGLIVTEEYDRHIDIKSDPDIAMVLQIINDVDARDWHTIKKALRERGKSRNEIKNIYRKIINIINK